MKKYMVLLFTIILVVAFVFSSNVAMAQTSSAPGPLRAEELEIAAEVTVAGAIALVIKDIDPWGKPSNENALYELGISYDVVHSVNLATVDLCKYRFIMYASDQTQSYYENLWANRVKIGDYVISGGLLLAHACDWGWGGGEWSNDRPILPGGVTHFNAYLQYIHITDPEHCVVEGLDDAYFYGWGWSTHGYFTELLLDTNIVMVTDDDKPTYIDYNYGRGKVMATMQTIEWGYMGNAWPGLRKEFLLNELECALEWKVKVFIDIKPGSCPNPFNVDSKGVLTVAILGTEDLDVTNIDPATISIEGVSPLRWAFEDVATPFEGELCDCHDMNGDGYLDLTLKFSTQDLVAAIGKGVLLEHEREMVPLTLSGYLKEEYCSRQIEGVDCVFILSSQRKK